MLENTLFICNKIYFFCSNPRETHWRNSKIVEYDEVTEEVVTTEETTVSEVETTSENTVVVTDEPEVTEVENPENLADEKEAE